MGLMKGRSQVSETRKIVEAPSWFINLLAHELGVSGSYGGTTYFWIEQDKDGEYYAVWQTKLLDEEAIADEL